MMAAELRKKKVEFSSRYDTRETKNAIQSNYVAGKQENPWVVSDTARKPGIWRRDTVPLCLLTACLFE